MSVQSVITNVIEKYGENITFTTCQTRTYDEDLGWITSGGSEETQKAVPYDWIKNNFNMQMIGNQDIGSTKLVIQYNLDVSDKDQFTYNSKLYEIISVNPLPLQADVLAQVLVANEVLSGENAL